MKNCNNSPGLVNKYTQYERETNNNPQNTYDLVTCIKFDIKPFNGQGGLDLFLFLFLFFYFVHRCEQHVRYATAYARRIVHRPK